jgi:hypothetical protein
MVQYTLPLLDPPQHGRQALSRQLAGLGFRVVGVAMPGKKF